MLYIDLNSIAPWISRIALCIEIVHLGAEIDVEHFSGTSCSGLTLRLTSVG